MKKSAKHFWIVAAICAGAALLCLALYGRYDPLTYLEFFTQDKRVCYGAKTPVDPRLVLIGIDRAAYTSSDFSDADLQANPTLQLLQRNFPWSRAVWAGVIQRLADAGAKVIVLDLIFAGQSDGDDALKQVLDKYKDRVVIGCNIHDTDSNRGNQRTLDVPNASVLNSSNSNSPAFDDRVGFVNIWPDEDGVLRRAQYRLRGDQTQGLLPSDVVLESLAARALRKFGRPDLIPAGFDAVRFRYTLAPGFGYVPHPIGDVLLDKTWRQNYANGEFFRDKIVLIGPTADIFQDTHATPFPATVDRRNPNNPKEHSSDMLGPEIHLNIIGAALQGGFLRDTPLTEDRLIIALSGLLALVLCTFVRQPLWRLATIFLLCVAYWVLGQTLFNRANLVIPIATPLLVLTISGVIVLGYDYFLEQFERARIRKTLERYVSKNVVKELLDNPETYFNSLVGVRRPVSILFSDVRGFTTLTESSKDEAKLVSQLNEYFEEMVRHVFSHGGSLDKFIGDAVMAVWGNILSHGAGRDAHQAVSTALAMRKSLVKLNEDWKARGLPELGIGIGINHGDVIVGNLGSTEKMELTVIGDAVNLGSRLEGLTKEYHLDLLLGENLVPLVGDQFILRTVDYVQVKGKTKPVDVFTVMGAGGAQTVSLPFWLARYEDGVRLYRARAFDEARAMFEECLKRQPDDYLCSMYADRCRALISNPPDESWNGVFVMTKK